MRDQVQATIDWLTATPKELDGRRCIITTSSGTIIDGHLRAIQPFPPDYQTVRFMLDDADLALCGLRILTINDRYGTAILYPHIKTLTVTTERKQQ